MGQLMGEDHPQVWGFDRQHDRGQLFSHRRHGVGIAIELADVKNHSGMDRRVTGPEEGIDPAKCLLRLSCAFALSVSTFGISAG